MFTGIIRHLGKIVSNTAQEDGSVVLEIEAPFSSELSEGDSVAVAGACLTVLSHTDTTWTCRLMAETIKKTTLGTAKPGDIVNLEQPAKAGDLLHGHIVQGHVDGLTTITEITSHGDDRVIRFQPTKEVLEHIVPKGSVTLDGVSLTVVDITDGSFTVSLMPYTLMHTTFEKKVVGDTVHIETDKARAMNWLSGKVVQGEGRGKNLGFPTANISLNSSSSFTEEGVFACRVMIEHDPTIYGGALHAGPRPTFPNSSPAVEIHLLHFPNQDIYGKEIRFTVVEKIRNTERFESLDDLKSAIQEDIEKIIAILLSR
jgi:riboflavin synthase